MEYISLGESGLIVSKICFGSLTISPLQRNLPLEQGVDLISFAVEQGINFIDTADLYDTYSYINKALDRHSDLIVATKSYAYDTQTAEQTLTKALKAINRDYIDIFLLHEQEGPLTLRGHKEALDFFIKQKQAGKIRAVGISTHHIAGVKAAADMDEIDIVHPVLNYRGLGIVDGSLEKMETAIRTAYENGKGIYTMKPLGGGHLIPHRDKAYKYIFEFPHIHSIAIGMQHKEEVLANVHYAQTKKIPSSLSYLLETTRRQIIIQDWCIGCGACVDRCSQNALSINDRGTAVVDRNKCILCGYCGTACKELAIKVI
jgi:predicted aldo/keto reductase-like oxidoreductase